MSDINDIGREVFGSHPPPFWDQTADVLVLKTYVGMVYEARSASKFKAALKALIDFVDEIDYLQEHGK